MSTVQLGTSEPTLVDNAQIDPIQQGDLANPIGINRVDVGANKIWVVFSDVQTIKEGTTYLFKLNPFYFNTKGALIPSHSQLEALRHVYVGPGKGGFIDLKLTSVANAFVNGRLLMAHIPYGYDVSKATDMKSPEFSQFNRAEHTLHGSDTFMTVQWSNPLPLIKAYSDSEEDTNGYIMIKILDFTRSTDAIGDPKFTLWVNTDRLTYTIPVPPALFKPQTTRAHHIPKFVTVDKVVSIKKDLKELQQLMIQYKETYKEVDEILLEQIRTMFINLPI